jgi:hypothetical protein
MLGVEFTVSNAGVHMTEEVRDCRVFYVQCPEGSDHFLLRDPADTKWEKTPPASPCKTFCDVCGKNYEVNVTEPWKIGYVSSEDRGKGWTLKEPLPAK